MTISPALHLPAIDAITVGAQQCCILSADGEIQSATHNQAQMQLHNKPVLCCYAPYLRQRMPDFSFYALDVLELFSFVHPATFCIPTPYGLCHDLNLPLPQNNEDAVMALTDITRCLLEHIIHDQYSAKAPAKEIAESMGLNGKGWGWTPYIFSALGEEYDPALPISIKPLLNVCKSLPEWEDSPPKPPHSHYPVTPDEAEQRLDDLLHVQTLSSNKKAETRQQQRAFTRHIAQSFNLPQPDESATIVVAEAGTGTGKTLGYLAPASVWADKNDSAVWVSTYTKNLQRQIDSELDRLYPNNNDKARNVAIRKGRENYLCLLNLHDSILALPTSYNPKSAIATGMMVRWVAAAHDGDLSGGQFPGWLSGLLGYNGTLGLADRRGECIYSACDHYKRCYSEHSVRNAKDAKIVIANHALVMIQSAMAGTLDKLPDHYVFDEGHHLFHAADSAFNLRLSAQETRDLRRWLLGGEGGRRGSRSRGLQRRVEDLCEGDEQSSALLADILAAAHQLTAEGWTRRLKNNAPQGPCEAFIHAVMQHVYAREQSNNSPYSLETDLHPVPDSLHPAIKDMQSLLYDLQKPMKKLADSFLERLHNDGRNKEDGQPTLDSATRTRLEAMANALEYRSSAMLQGWLDLLLYMLQPIIPENDPKTQNRVSWMEITRSEGQASDVGVISHWIDPMHAFAQVIEPHLNGMAITSATLSDKEIDDNDNDSENTGIDTQNTQSWDMALRLSGVNYLSKHPQLFSAHSPFEYKNQSKVIIISDVNKMDGQQVASAMQSLFSASGGGGLGLFTAISRLRFIHDKIAAPLEQQGISLYAQHIDAVDTGTLIDMFRFDRNACMLGTDATRDGVDVPGDSLRLLVFDRVPWPRPTLLHKARRDHFGGRSYDEMLTRMKLKQAFGRLIRRADDKGIFVMLDSALPSRLHDAFPPDVEIIKCGLAEACTTIKSCLS